MSNVIKNVKLKDRYWRVECTKHLETLFKTSINIKHITEKSLKNFIRALMAKYAFSDDEILEQHVRIPFKKFKNLVQIVRTNELIK